jgi:sec-independent protein translocase protein TatB
VFDIGFSELLVVFVVGLLILGPERLPVAAKTAGLWIRKIRRSIQSVQREINAQLDQEELQRSIKETNERIMRETAKFEQDVEAPSPAKATASAASEVSPESVQTSEKEPATAAKSMDETQSRA